MEKSFPRTEVAGISLPRMIIGTNWIDGYSHTSAAQDKLIVERHRTAESVAGLLAPFLEWNINAMMGQFKPGNPMWEGARLAEQQSGKSIIQIDTPELNVDDNTIARQQAESRIRQCARNGSQFCLIHHTSAEQLVNKNLRSMPRLPDYLTMIRDAGMIPGLSAHMPELVIYSDANGYDVETYIQIYNALGFMMQIEIEYVNKVIRTAKKPVMTIKPMAAGRCSPFVGLNFAWSTLRECDMVTLGCFTPEEAVEDIEISLACFERRLPNISGRTSPIKSEIMV